MSNDKEKDSRRCEKCKSTLTYIRTRDNTKKCRQCGYIEKLEDKKK